jgi:hypothetical protein
MGTIDHPITVAHEYLCVQCDMAPKSARSFDRSRKRPQHFSGAVVAESARALAA